jgi:hypothetical protein
MHDLDLKEGTQKYLRQKMHRCWNRNRDLAKHSRQIPTGLLPTSEKIWLVSSSLSLEAPALQLTKARDMLPCLGIWEWRSHVHRYCHATHTKTALVLRRARGPRHKASGLAVSAQPPLSLAPLFTATSASLKTPPSWNWTACSRGMRLYIFTFRRCLGSKRIQG